MSLVTLLLVASASLSAARARGQEAEGPSPALHHYAHVSWTMRDGLPSNIVRDVLQTRDGHLWLATQGGLVRFDGVRFKTFDARNTPALRTSEMLVLREGRDGALWVGARGWG